MSASFAAMCQPCQPGKYANEKGTNACKNCPAGRSSSAEASTSCKKCLQGYSNRDVGKSACTVCSSGQYSDILGALNCSTCPPNSVQAKGAASCTCREGYRNKYATLPPECIQCSSEGADCSRCNGIIDANGYCCEEGILDAAKVCCQNGASVDACGICGESGESCGISVALKLSLNIELFTSNMKQKVREEVADSMKLPLWRINVGEARAGSIELDVTIKPFLNNISNQEEIDRASDLRQDTRSMAVLEDEFRSVLENRQSLLYSGQILKHIDTTHAPKFSRSGVRGNGFCEVGEDSTSCSDCPRRKRPIPYVRPGFWRSSMNDARIVYSCLWPASCIGNSKCLNGTMGVVCGVCKSGFRMTSSYSCSSCPDANVALGSSVLMVLLWLVAMRAF